MCSPCWGQSLLLPQFSIIYLRPISGADNVFGHTLRLLSAAGAQALLSFLFIQREAPLKTAMICVRPVVFFHYCYLRPPHQYMVRSFQLVSGSDNFYRDGYCHRTTPTSALIWPYICVMGKKLLGSFILTAGHHPYYAFCPTLTHRHALLSSLIVETHVPSSDMIMLIFNLTQMPAIKCHHHCHPITGVSYTVF